MTIRVTYAASDSGDIFGTGEKEHNFETFVEFKEWLERYVCSSCLANFKEYYGREPLTVREYLCGGCGCEIDIEDEDSKIFFDDLVNWRKQI